MAVTTSGSPPASPASHRPIRWVRWAVVSLAMLGTFAIAGFLALPWLIQSRVPAFAEKTLHRKATIGEVRINPFSLRAEVRDFQLSEADGTPIAGFAALVADLEWSSITRRAWHLAELRLTEPKALLDIAPDGRVNLAALADDLAHDSPPDKAGAMPRLVIDAIVIERGRADFTDRRAGYSNALVPIDLRFDNLSTLPEDKGPYTLVATTAKGGTLKWKGVVSLNPMSASGVVSGTGLSLPDASVYAKSYTGAEVTSGKAGFELPYKVAYREGRLDASVDGAGLSIDALAVRATASAVPFFDLKTFRIGKVRADYASRSVEIGEILADDGKLAAKRDAKGVLDLLALLKTPPSPGTASVRNPPEPATPWKVKVAQFSLEHFALAFEDRTAPAPLTAAVGQARLKAALDIEAGGTTNLRATGIEAGLSAITAGNKGESLVRIGDMAIAGGEIDASARTAKVASISVSNGKLKLVRDKAGHINLLDLVPGPGAVATPVAKGKQDPAWKASVGEVNLTKFTAEVQDQESGQALGVQDFTAKLAGLSSDPARPVAFDAGFTLREGGKFLFKGQAFPARQSLESGIKVEKLSLKPVQPVLSRQINLKLADGTLSAQGKVSIAPADGKAPRLRFVGGGDVANLKLDEEGGEVFAAWKSVAAADLVLTVQPNRLEVPELRVEGLNAKLLINADRSLNATRLLVQPAGASAGVPAPAAPSTAPAAQAPDPFPISVRRLRVVNARLEFADLSLRPQFGAKIHDLNGIVNGLSTDTATRSQIELDGRVDEFGLARIRGEMNPFAPKNNTDVSVVFRNIDLVSASTYSMKFAGYRIASGKISLDLNYKVRDSRLEGKNSVVLDQLTLGEKVDSPDATNLPLELALAILKDSDGKIALDLPVSGSLDDPQFSYGAVIWKAVLNVITRIVTAPFRALGALFGISGDKLGVIDFDAGSAKLLPPEREKLKQVATVLAKRTQLRLAVPGQYNEAVDSAALRARALRLELAGRAGIKVAEGDEPGPPDLEDTAVRGAIRATLTERHGAADWDKRKAEAERGAAGAPITMIQRAQRLGRGEPQVADLAPLYRGIIGRLEQSQTLAPDAMQQLAKQRSDAILDSLKAAGVDAGRLSQPASQATEASPGKPVPVKLGLSSR